MLRWRERNKPRRASYGGVEDERAARRDGVRAFWWSPPEVYEKSIYYSAAMNHGTACGGSGRDQRGREEKRRRAALIPAGDPVAAQRLRRAHVFVSTRHDCRLDLELTSVQRASCFLIDEQYLQRSAITTDWEHDGEHVTANTWKPLFSESQLNYTSKTRQVKMQKTPVWSFTLRPLGEELINMTHCLLSTPEIFHSTWRLHLILSSYSDRFLFTALRSFSRSRRQTPGATRKTELAVPPGSPSTSNTETKCMENTLVHTMNVRPGGLHTLLRNRKQVV